MINGSHIAVYFVLGETTTCCHIRPLPLIKCVGMFYVERCAAHYSFDIDTRLLIEQLAGTLMFVGTNEPPMTVYSDTSKSIEYDLETHPCHSNELPTACVSESKETPGNEPCIKLGVWVAVSQITRPDPARCSFLWENMLCYWLHAFCYLRV